MAREGTAAQGARGGLPSRRAYLTELAADIGTSLVVTGMGDTTRDWAVLRPSAKNFYLCGAMGHAIPLAVGLAAARPDQAVVACENDGGLIMNLGCLITAAGLELPNLSIIVFDNGAYESSGGQEMPGRGTDYATVARGCGIDNADTVIDVVSFGSLFRRYRATGATSLIHARIESRRTTPREVFDLHPARIFWQFAGLGGS